MEFGDLMDLVGHFLITMIGLALQHIDLVLTVIVLSLQICYWCRRVRRQRRGDGQDIKSK